MKVLIVGAGYVGLTTAVVLAKQHQVTLIDTDEKRVDMIRKGESPIEEEGLDDLLKSALSSNALECRTSYDVEHRQDLIMICVGTPPNPDGSPNLKYIESVVSELSENCDCIFGDYTCVALRSTVSPGTTRNIVYEPLKAKCINTKLGVVYSPEFLAQGRAIHDILNPDRIVIGSLDEMSARTYLDAQTCCMDREGVPVFRMSLESAELCKLASNYYLAMKVSFANELASLAERIPDANIDHVLQGVKSDHRIHPSHLGAGLGYGGSCLPKDTINLLTYGKSLDVTLGILQSVIQVNQESTSRLMRLFRNLVGEIDCSKIAVLGLAFKAGTDDTRDSPSIGLIEELISEGYEVSVHDPLARIDNLPSSIKNSIVINRELSKCTEGASVAFIMTDWDCYREAGITTITSNMKNQIVIDGRRMFTDSFIPEEILYGALGSYVDAVP